MIRGSGSGLGSRMGHHGVEPFTLPDDFVHRLSRFMERMGLVYGAIDVRLTPEGKYVFLEVNTSGQWIFMEEKTGQPITDTFVELLMVQRPIRAPAPACLSKRLRMSCDDRPRSRPRRPSPASKD
jgi:hypothetical protein